MADPEERCAIARQGLALMRKLHTKSPLVRTDHLRSIQRELGRALSLANHMEEACEIANDIVTSYREEFRNTDKSDRRPLATSLCDLAAHLLTMGRSNDATAARREAVSICSQLWTANPALYATTSDNFLLNMGRQWCGSGNLRDAAIAWRERILIRRKLYQSSSDRHPFFLLSSLAVFHELITPETPNDLACTVWEEHAIDFQRLWKASRFLYFANVTHSLWQLSSCYHAANLRRDAMHAREQAVTIYNNMFRNAPDARFAMTVTNNVLESASPERAEALITLREHVFMIRRFYENNPDIFHQSLAVSLWSWGKLLVADGQPASAWQAFLEPVSMYRARMAEHPNDQEYQQFVISLYELKEYHMLVGGPKRALTVWQEQVGLFRELWVDDLNIHSYYAACLRDLADALQMAGLMGDALEVFRELVNIYVSMCSEDSDAGRGYVHVADYFESLQSAQSSLVEFLERIGAHPDIEPSSLDAAYILCEDVSSLLLVGDMNYGLDDSRCVPCILIP